MKPNPSKWREVERRVLPIGWKVRSKAEDGCHYLRLDGLAVIASVAMESDGHHWLHVSASYPDRLPSWDNLKSVKALFIGKDREAIQILPPEAEYVNVHPHVLHLWCCLDERVAPAFAVDRGGII